MTEEIKLPSDEIEPFEFKQESKAFEEHAMDRGMVMAQHPLHYIFMDKETSLAREIWKQAILYADMSTCTQDATIKSLQSEIKAMGEVIEVMREALLVSKPNYGTHPAHICRKMDGRHKVALKAANELKGGA